MGSQPASWLAPGWGGSRGYDKRHVPLWAGALTGDQERTADTAPRVGVLRPDDAAQAGELLATSHDEYPAFRHLFPDPVQRRRALRPFMATTARDAALFGRCFVARDDLGMLGVALWMPPGTFPLSATRKARMTPALLRVALSAPRSFPAFARTGAGLEKAHPPGPLWYLQALGVHRRAQRRGVGGQLVTPALAMADENGAACHLHTSDPANIAYYQRFGFEVAQPAFRVFPGGPAYIGMSREPAEGHPRRSAPRSASAT